MSGSNAAARPRVMLVDDDATLRRLVAMMLEDLPIAFIACAGAAQAREVLQAAPVHLLITDWMMPGESGLDLLHWLQAHPQQRAQAKLVVLSAGLGEAVLAQIAGLDVWRTLSKPVTVQAMELCVREALGWDADQEPAALAPSVLSEGETRALRHYFAGNLALFQAFKADCAQQLPADMVEGEAAFAAQDAAALRRLAHNLKSVSRSLGREAAAEVGQRLEDACLAQDWPAAQRLWPQLRQLCLQAGQG